MKDLLKEIIADFHQAETPKAKAREIEIPVLSSKIITLVGPRRSGKSFLFYRIMSQLLEKGISKTRVIYLNLEDERLTFNAENLNLIIEAYRELYPQINLKDCFFFFDEIQNASGWEKFIRRIYDNYSKQIFLTGSNAQLLSSEIATALRGRTISYEILPLSFNEYLNFLNLNIRKKDSQTKALVNRAFDNYLTHGGYPELLSIDNNLKSKVMLEYFDVMTYRDLIQRYQFHNIPVVKFFLKKIAANCCSYLSIHKVYNEIRSLGYKLDKNLLYSIFEAALSSHFCFAVKKFHFSEIKREKSEKKIYFIDNGLLNSLTFRFSSNYGLLLENAVYLELRRQEYELFYYKNKTECDFIIRNKDHQLIPIQVCYRLSDPKTKEREMRGLKAACLQLNLKKGIIICMDEEKKTTENGIAIEYISAIQLLSKQISI